MSMEDLAKSSLDQRIKSDPSNLLLRYTRIPINEWFITDAWKHGANIDHADESNPKVGLKRNCIQITSTDHIAIYDLDTEQELDHVLFYENFVEIDYFVNPGCELYSLREKDKPKFSRGSVLDNRGNIYEVSSDKISCNQD